MLHLNFLSPETKQETRIKRWYSVAKRVEASLVLLTAAIALIFGAARFLLAEDFNRFARETALFLQTNGRAYGSRITDINNELTAITGIQNDFVSSYRLIAEISSRIPDGVSIASLKIDNTAKTILLAGRAKTRNDFKDLKKNLSASPALSEINFPIQNILEEANIAFSITAKIDQTKLPAAYGN